MRPTPLLLAVAFVLVVLSLPAPAAAAGLATSASERSLLAEMNRVRAARGLAPLRRDAALHRAARYHTNDMLARRYFAHGAFDARMRRFRVRGPLLAENLAWTAPADAAAAVIVRMWLLSPPHRRNLLRPGFRRVGIGAAIDGSTKVVTADFAGR